MIRAAHMRDADAITDLLDQLGYPQEGGAVPPRLERWLADGDSHLLVAETGGEVLGVLALHLCPYFQRDGRWARVTALAVDEAARRAGVGAELLAAAESLASDLGCSEVEITCSRSRDAAQAFYAARGYEDVSPRAARFKKALG